MPDGSPGPGPVNALVLADEDAVESALLGRLKGLGADLARVSFLDIYDDDLGQVVALPHPLDRLTAAVVRVEARLVLLDPVVSALGPRVSMNNEQSVRRALRPLRQLARQHRFLPLMVRNLNKSGGRRAVYRGAGALGFLGMSRSGWLFGHDPADPARVAMAQQKNNLAPPQPSLAYRIDRQPDGRARLEWAGPCAASAADLLAAAGHTAPPGPRDSARDFLKEVLKDGPCLPRVIWKAAEAHGLGVRTLQRARKDLDIRVVRRSEGQTPVYYWQLPGQQFPGPPAPADDDTDLGPWLRPLEEKYPPRSPLDEP